MKSSVTARAARHNPQPLPKKSVDTVNAPARIGLAKHHTFVTSPGVVELTHDFSPGHRKLVTSRADGVVLVAGVAELKTPGAWVLAENTGDGWTGLYLGGGAVGSKNTTLREK